MSTGTEISPEHVRDLWRVLGVRFNFRTATKSDPRAAALGRLVVAAGIIKETDWQERFASYIPLPHELGGPTVFLPFTPGKVNDLWPLEAQFYIGIHETQHAVQYQRDPIRFLGTFLGSSADRANYEREARGAVESARYAIRGVVADPHVATSSIGTSYGCRMADVEVAAEDLRLDEQTILAGGITAAAAKAALDWWNEQV